MDVRTLYIRLAMIAFWVLIGIGFLLLPSITQLFTFNDAINIVTWSATIDPLVIEKFTQETGIKVNINYIESNEELFVKMHTSKGAAYDLILPSDYALKKFVDNGLLQPIDKSKLNFWDRIMPRLLNQSFDPNNTYCIPYHWTIYGIGIDKDFFKERIPPASWSLLFSYPIGTAKVGMFNVAREAIMMTALYLFGDITNLNDEKTTMIQNNLISQKSRVEAYIDADIRSNYMLISKMSPIVIATTTYIAKIMEEFPSIEFLIPREGSFLLIDSFAISASSKKQDAIYALINFLYRPEHIEHHFKQFPFTPVTTNLYELMKTQAVAADIIAAHFDETINLYSFKDVIAESVANNIWISVKTT
jgi:spermidine/putrescine transport system substrate-binding protein